MTPSPAVETPPAPPVFYAANRGGGLFSEAVSQHAGAYVAAGAYKRGIAPSVLTVVNLGLGGLVSFAIVALADPVAQGRVWAWPVGLLALLGWQLAYAFDCAGGQLAQVSGRASAAGERLDVLCGMAVQISLVAAIAATAKAQEHSTPAWLLAAFAGTWMITVVTSVLPSGPPAPSVATGWSLPVRVAKLVRDHGAVILVAGVVLAVAPQWSIWYVGVFTLVNAAFLAAGVIFAAREALRA